MMPIVVFRGPSVLIRISLLLCVLTAPIFTLRAQVTVPAPGGTLGAALNPVTNKVYRASVDSNTGAGFIAVIDGATNAVSTIPTPLGANPAVPAVNPVTNKIYVTNNGSANVTVIDGATGTVKATLPAGTGPFAAAVNPVTNKVYVANLSSPYVTVIDGSTDTVEASVPVAAGQYAMALNPVTNKVYVSSSNPNSVTVIDGATNASSQISLTFGAGTLAVNPVTNKIYAAGGGTAAVIDGADNQVLKTMSTGFGNPGMIAVNPVTNKIYVSEYTGTTVAVIDGATDNITNRVTVGAGPLTMGVNSVTNKIYVGGTGTGAITVIDGATNTPSAVTAQTNPVYVTVNPVTNKIYALGSSVVTVIDGAINAVTSTSPISTGSSTSVMAVNPLTNKLYVPNFGSDAVTVIDVTTNSPTATSPIGVGSGPGGVAIDPVTNKIYVTNSTGGTVSVINGSNDTVINTVPVGSFPQSIAFNSVTKRVYVCHPLASTSPTVIFGNTISVIDETTDTVIATVTVGFQPSAIAVNSATNKIYVANSQDNTVSVINGATGTVSSIVPVGTSPGGGPQGIAINPVTNRIFVVNTDFNNSMQPSSVSIIDGSVDNVIATVPAGVFPREIAINTATNKIYVDNSNAGGTSTSGGSVTVIDGATNTATQINTSSFGNYPWGITVNPITNNVYVANYQNNSNNLMVIDGASNTVINTVANIGTNPEEVLVYPAANKIYVTLQTTGVTVINVDGHQTVPLTTTVAGVVDPQTVSTVNVFQTSNQTPSFTVDVNSMYNASSVYSGLTVTNPPPTQVYYEVDGANPSNLATATSSGGANPGSFSITLPTPQQFGLHTLYVYAAYGDEGGATQGANASGSASSPNLGNVTAYLFLVVPISTTTNVTADVNPQVLNQPVIFTAQVAPIAPTTGPDPTGPVTFYDGTTVLGTGSINGSGAATFTTSSLSLGNHTITAAYPGDANYAASTSSALTETIVSPPSPTIILVGGDDQTAAYGNAFTQLLVVGVQQSNGTPAAGVTVTFAGAGVTFAATTVTTDSNGRAGVMATGTMVGDLVATATTPGVTDTVYFALTVTPALLTVTANNASRVYGTANPPLTGTVTGAVRGDTFTVTASTIALTDSPVGTYPITPAVTGTALSNYTVHTVNGTLTVTKATSTAVVTGTSSEVIVGTSVTLTATVPAGATGTVTFYDGSTALGTAEIVGNTATLVISTLAPGIHTITAAYSGDGNFAPATSPAFTVTVVAPDFAIANGTPPQLIPPGASASYNISITSVNVPFTNVVTLTATNLPPNATYTFTPSTVTPGSAGTTSNFTVSVPKQSAAKQRSSRTPLVLAVLLLPLAVFRRSRGRQHRLLLWMLVTLTLFGSATGCGVGGYFSLPQQTYVITITGTSGNLVHSTTATLTVE